MDRLQAAFTDPKFWKLEHCCFAWDLKSGALMSTVTGFTVMLCALLAITAQFQLLYQKQEEPEVYRTAKLYQIIHYALAYTYLSIGLVAFVVAFLGSYLQHFLLTLVGLCLIMFTFLFWIGLIVPSYKEKFYGLVCIKSRCPDMHWFVESRWRDFRLALQELDCRGKKYGKEPPPIKPAVVIYPRWFTRYDLYSMNKLCAIYKLCKPTAIHRDKPIYMSPFLKKINKTKKIKNVRLKKLAAQKNKKLKKQKKTLKRKSGNTSRMLYRKFQDSYEEEEPEYDEYVAKKEEEPEVESAEEDEAENIGSYIPLYKLAPPVEIIFQAVSIFFAVLWGVYMTNTVLVLLYYVFLLYEEEMAVEEEEEEERKI